MYITIGTLIGHKNVASSNIFSYLNESTTEMTGNILKESIIIKGKQWIYIFVFTVTVFFCKPFLWLPRAISSAGRATALQAVGHKFEPCIAHHIPRIPGS